MAKPELLVLIPSRGRPGNIKKVISAWDFTNAWDVADMMVIVDADDPEIRGYHQLEDPAACPMMLAEVPTWRPMVHKLNEVAALYAQLKKYFAIAFAGDDHLPQTINWAKRYLAVLNELGTGMVFGDDGFQGANLSTEWAVTADAVRALGRMVPAPVEHMYCDNSMMDVFGRAGAMRHLPEVRIEHMHPIAGKAENDDQYQRVNHRDQFRRDRREYEGWKLSGMTGDVAAIRALRANRPDVASGVRKPGLLARSMPRERKTAVSRSMAPREFRYVKGATPDEIGVTLADLARQVPKDQAIVEIGVYQGRTALLMAWGARQGQGAHVWGIDAWGLEANTYDAPFKDDGSRRWAVHNLRMTGYNNDVTLINDFSLNVARDWAGPKIGLLFVDGDHSKDGATADIKFWAPHLAPGAVIAIDDYDHPDYPGVAEAVEDLVAEGFLEPVQIFHDRLAVTRLAGKDGDEIPGPGRVTAITAEGVSPSPEGAVADDPFEHPTGSECSDEWCEDKMQPGADPDTEESTDGPVYVTEEGELSGIPVKTPIDTLNIAQLRQLAKRRGIVLGRRKDLRSEILQALRDGK